MDAPYKSAILALRPKLQVNLIADHFLASLHQDCEGFLNDFEEDDVKSARGKVKKVTVLLDILVKKDNEAFHKFCRVLERSNNRVWADKLRAEASSIAATSSSTEVVVTRNMEHNDVPTPRSGPRPSFYTVKPTLILLTEHVVPVTAAYWYDTGLYLGVEAHVLDLVREDYPHASKQCCREVFKLWLQKKVGSGERTWESVLVAVQKSCGMRKDIEEKLASVFGTSGATAGDMSVSSRRSTDSGTTTGSPELPLPQQATTRTASYEVPPSQDTMVTTDTASTIGATDTAGTTGTTDTAGTTGTTDTSGTTGTIGTTSHSLPLGQQASTQDYTSGVHEQVLNAPQPEPYVREPLHQRIRQSTGSRRGQNNEQQQRNTDVPITAETSRSAGSYRKSPVAPMICVLVAVGVIMGFVHFMTNATSQCTKLSDVPSVEVIQDVCRLLSKDWRILCGYLAVPDWKVKEVEEQFPRDPRQSCIECLKWWGRGNTKDKPPRYDVLMEELRRSERPDIVNNLYDKNNFCSKEA